MNTRIQTFLLSAGLFSAGPLGYAQSTAFSVQGRLNSGSTPAIGDYEMQFSTYTSATGGLPAATFIPPSPITVADGLFTTKVDFGNGVFNGTNRWLEIRLRPVGAGSFIVLSNRIELTSSPYSVRTLEAASLSAGSLTASQLHIAGAPPAAGQVLGFNGSDLYWTSGGGGGGSNCPWILQGTNVYYAGGNVGIGTSTPAVNLHTLAGVSASHLIETVGDINAWAKVQFKNLNGQWDIGTSRGYVGDVFYIDRIGTSALEFALAPNGNLGLGTAPQAKLHLYDPAGSLSQRLQTDGDINAWTRLEFANGNGQWNVGTSRGFVGDVFYIDRVGTSAFDFALAPNGNLGLGTAPQAKLHLYDPAGSLSQRLQTDGDTNAWTRLEFANGNGQWNVGTSRGYNGDQFYFQREGAASPAFSVQPNGDGFFAGNVGIGLSSGSPQARLDINGATRTKVLTITGGADLAEPFQLASDAITPGSVVIIDEQNAGQLKLSERAYDTRVAGIVSGANGVNPGISLRQEGMFEGGKNVALSGRVFVQADASYGAIKPGDLLTTSARPGHAMKAVDHARAPGAILGKAMSPLNEGTGMVLVLVTLQ